MRKMFALFVAILFVCSMAYGADTKLTDLTADTSPTNDDLLYTVNDPSGTPASKKVAITNLPKAWSASQIQNTAMNWTSLSNSVQSAGINWSNINTLQPIANGGINWTSVSGTIPTASINWSSVKNSEIQKAGINWTSLSQDLQTAGINWSSIKNSEIQKAGVNWTSLSNSVPSAGINWSDVSGYGNSKTLKTDESGNVVWSE